MHKLSLRIFCYSALLLSACGNRTFTVPAPPAFGLQQPAQAQAIAQTTTQPTTRPVTAPNTPIANASSATVNQAAAVAPEPQNVIPTQLSEPPALANAKAAEIRLFRSFGTTESLHLKARVIKPESGAAAQADDSKLTSLIRNLKGFTVDELDKVRIRFEIEGQVFYASSNQEGMIDLSATLGKALTPGLHTLTATVAGGQQFQSGPYQAELVVHTPQDQSLGFISDIDDTIKISKVANKLAAAKKLLTLNPYQAEAMPGTSTLYQILENLDKKVDGDFFYLSGSPQNLSPEIYTFLDYQGFPSGAVELKKWGFKKGDDNPIQQENYKHDKLKAIFETYPAKSFVLFGDSSEKDTEIYLKISAEYPGQVKAIFINNVTDEDPTDPRFDGVNLTSNAAEAARILQGLKLLSTAQVSQVEQSL